MRRLFARIASTEGIVTLVVLVVCGALVLYPVLFLFAESLNVGDPENFPATELGFANYGAVFEDVHVLADTAFIAVMATVMAVLFGFVLAWILTRTEIPGRARLERMMELPYYMTPLVGALAWGILAGPKSGFLNQLWHLVGGTGDPFNVYSAFGI